MSVASTIKLVVSGDTHGGIKALKDVQAEAGKTGFSFGTMAKAAGVGVLAIGAAAVAAGTVLVKAGDKLNESQDLLKNALNDTHQSVKGLSTTLAPLMSQMQKWGYTNDEVNDGLATLVRSGDKVSTATQDMALAANIAKGRNIDLATAEQLLVKVRTGHVSLLGRYGIATKDAEGKTISITQAVSKLSDMYKGSANTASESLAGKTAALHAAFTNLEEHLGQKLIPVLTEVATWITDKLLPAFATFVKWIEDNWPKIWAAIKPVLDTITGYVDGFVTTLEKLWHVFGNTLVTYAKDAFGSLKTAFEGVFTTLEGVFRLFADLFTGKWGKLWGDVLTIFSGLWKIIKATIGLAWSSLTELVGVAWDAIGNVIKAAWNGIINFFKASPGRIAGAFAGMWNGIGSAFKGVLNYVIGLWDGLHFTLPTITVPKVHIPGLGDIGGGSFGGETFRVPQIPYFHEGGIFDAKQGQREGLAMLSDGEGIFTQAQMRALGAYGGSKSSGGNTIINFPTGAAPAAVNAAQTRWNRRNGKT